MSRLHDRYLSIFHSGLRTFYTFPAVFYYDDDGISVVFPDLPGAFSYGLNIQQAYRNAKEALGLHLYGMELFKERIPKPSDLSQITIGPNQAIGIVEVYMPAFRELIESNG